MQNRFKNKEPFFLTCSCGNAMSFSRGVCSNLIATYHEELTGSLAGKPLLPVMALKRINSSYNDPKLIQVLKDCGVYDYIQGINTGSSKLLILPSINSWINLKESNYTLAETKGVEIKELYDYVKSI